MSYTNISDELEIVEGVKENKVANFAYTDAAYIGNQVEGSDTYSASRGNNIPTTEGTDFQSSILHNGVRAQAASIPRNAINHFFGRVSYNLNKLVDKVYSLLTMYRDDVRHNLRAWDSTTPYQTGDTVWMHGVSGDIYFYTALQPGTNQMPADGDDNAYWQCTNRSNVFIYEEDGVLHIEDARL